MADPLHQTTSKAGTYDTLMDADGREAEVYIIEDEPTYMLVEIVEGHKVLRLEKHAQ